MCIGCHHSTPNPNCSFNSIFGTYAATDLANSVTNCTGSCPNYTLQIVQNSNCNSITIRNIDVTGTDITADYLGTAGTYITFQIPGQTYKYQGTTYNTSVSSTAVFNGNQVSIIVNTGSTGIITVSANK